MLGDCYTVGMGNLWVIELCLTHAVYGEGVGVLQMWQGI